MMNTIHPRTPRTVPATFRPNATSPCPRASFRRPESETESKAYVCGFNEESMVKYTGIWEPLRAKRWKNGGYVKLLTCNVYAYANMLILEEHRTNLLTSVETLHLRNYVVVALLR